MTKLPPFHMKGVNGTGDQGSFVIVTFPRVNDARITHYRIHREMEVTTGLEESGNLVLLDESVLKFMPWAVIDPPPVITGEDSLVIAVVPAIDNPRDTMGGSR